MRRYNEKRFREQILEVLGNWSEELKKAHRIFLYGPGINWNYFFTGSTGLNRADPRIRSVPFSVSRPSLEEVRHIHKILSTIEVKPYDPSSDVVPIPEELEITPVSNTLEIELVDDTPPPEDLIASAIKKGDLEGLISLFESDYEIPLQSEVDQIRTPVFLAVEHNHPEILAYLLDLDTGDIDSPIPGWSHRTALHRAVADENQKLVTMLLNSGADPAPKDLYSQTPYLIASKNMRTFLRKFAGQNPDMHDWQKIGINPITSDKEIELKKKM